MVHRQSSCLILGEYLDIERREGRTININWRYRTEDDTMQEAGEDFQEDIEACKFELVAIENTEE